LCPVGQTPITAPMPDDDEVLGTLGEGDVFKQLPPIDFEPVA